MKKRKKKTPVIQHIHLEFDAKALENETWLTTDDLMKLLKVSRSTVYRLRKQNKIPNFKLGNIPMFPKCLLTKLFIQKSINNINQ